ncbi:MAG: roadblock/LC7 domain-containing protein [Desulfatirhabdiaceae bacterium]
MTSPSDSSITLMEYALGQEQLEHIERILQKDIINIGAHFVMLIDMAGNVIALCDNGKTRIDAYSLAALAAANFGAVEAMARLVGESEFSLLFHKGEQESLHFYKITSDLLLITLFGRDITLGLLRMKAADTARRIREIWK